MIILANFIDQFLKWSFNSSNLQILLLVGSGILAIGLLTLALTRWGASKPVWKCVILSVMAHVLLIGFAWATHLIKPEEQDRLSLSEPMRVNFEEDLGASTKEDEEADLEPSSVADSASGWDGFPVQSPLPNLVPADTLGRPSISSSLVSVEKVVPQTNPSVSQRQPIKPLAMPKLESRVIKPTALANQFEQPKASLPPVTAAKLVQSPQQPASQKGNRDSDDTTSIVPEATLDAPDNTFEDAKINAGSVDRFQAPRLSEGQFDNPNHLPQMPVVDGQFEQPKSKQSELAAAETTPAAPAIATRLADGQPMPQVYSLRSPENRLQAAITRGGSPETERAVARALKWLAENQSKDGRWNPRKLGGGREDRVLGHDREEAGSNSDSGITALAALAFMANGHTHLEGPYQHVVQNALEYIVAQQDSNGELAGGAKLFARMYCHSMSLLAISEAYAMTGDRRLAVAVQRGVNFSLKAQNPRDGGWRYQPGDEGDMSQFGWQVLALHSAEVGGIDVPRSSKDNMVRFLDACCISPNKGVAAYRPGQGPNTTMTAEALVCRNLLGQRLSPLTVQEAHQRIAKSLPTPEHVNMYYWYYGTLAMFVTGGDAWEQWNQQMKHTLLTLQTTSGVNAGSWEPNGLWAGYGGRAYSTAMGALTLEVYYRYLPVYDVANRTGRGELR